MEIPLKDVITRRRLSERWQPNDLSQGQIDMKLQWLPILGGWGGGGERRRDQPNEKVPNHEF